MKAAFYTLGCKVNQYETQALSEALMREGFLIVPSSEDADVYIINSCTVTAESDKKTRQAVRRFKRLHPDSVCLRRIRRLQASLTLQISLQAIKTI